MKNSEIKVLMDDGHMHVMHGMQEDVIERDMYIDVKDMYIKDMKVKDMDIAKKGYVYKGYELNGVVKCMDVKDLSHAYGWMCTSVKNECMLCQWST